MAMTKTKRAQNDALIKNNLTYLTNFGPLYNMACTRIEWEGMPDTVDTRFLERCLVNEGEVIFFKDEDLGFLALPASSVGRRDVYGRPSGWWVWGYNGYHNFVTADQGVRILNDMTHSNLIPTIERFARILQNLDEMLNINVETCKRPLIIQCSEEQRKSLDMLYNDIEKNKPIILADKNLDAKELGIFQTGAEFSAELIIGAYNKMLDRYLSYLGIENSDTEKKERLVAAQISANNGLVECMRDSALTPRQTACDEIKQKFGLDISVKFRSALPTILNRPDLVEQSVGTDREYNGGPLKHETL